ncbi:MAG: type II secretion system F family protein [Desulfobacteraceae bacterium]|nr:type II secretion system F family protein [Desulfobacteraceae bacterium]
MPAYRCKITSKDGQMMERVIQSGSVSSLKKMIAREGRFLVDAEKTSDHFSFAAVFSRQKLKVKDFYSFNQEFLTLLRAGLPAVVAFDGIIENQRGSYFTNILKSIRNDISEGESLPAAFEKHESFFSPLYIAVLRSGEISGSIPDAIEEFLEYFERSRLIRQKIKAASVYPAILTICSISVMIFLIVFVVPVITGSFVEANADLPLFTKILLQFSDLIRFYWWAIISAIILLVYGIYYFLGTEYGKLFFDTHYLKLPFVGELSIIYSTALFSSSLSTVLAGGTPLNQAINISCRLIKNSFMMDKIQNAAYEIEQGDGFANALGRTEVFPDMALRMFAAGEEGGSLEKVLKDVAYFYEREVENKLTIVASTIEPVLMILMGFIIGFIIVAMYMPIFQLAEVMA